ncbi:MAG: hypothetical protein FWG25_02705 [Promicromonosporaceae bacterium]|nr:hypothetical protein [Promicromonosporaceae bacterium]
MDSRVPVLALARAATTRRHVTTFPGRAPERGGKDFGLVIAVCVEVHRDWLTARAGFVPGRRQLAAARGVWCSS